MKISQFTRSVSRSSLKGGPNAQNPLCSFEKEPKGIVYFVTSFAVFHSLVISTPNLLKHDSVKDDLNMIAEGAKKIAQDLKEDAKQIGQGVKSFGADVTETAILIDPKIC